MFKTFLKRQEKTIAEDEMRASAQTSMQKINKQIEAASQRSKSKNIIRSGKVSMLTSAADLVLIIRNKRFYGVLIDASNKTTI